MRDPVKGRTYIVAEARMDAIPGAVPKQKKGKKGGDSDQKGFEVCPTTVLLCVLRSSASCYDICSVYHKLIQNLTVKRPLTILFRSSSARSWKSQAGLVTEGARPNCMLLRTMLGITFKPVTFKPELHTLSHASRLLRKSGQPLFIQHRASFDNGVRALHQSVPVHGPQPRLQVAAHGCFCLPSIEPLSP